MCCIFNEHTNLKVVYNLERVCAESGQNVPNGKKKQHQHQ